MVFLELVDRPVEEKTPETKDREKGKGRDDRRASESAIQPAGKRKNKRKRPRLPNQL